MIRAIITDIEGTTSSISYVRDVMFPYSRQKLRTFLMDNWDKEEVARIIRGLEEKLRQKVSLELAIRTFEDWIDKDLKEPLLKELQGHIWEEGFQSGDLKGHVYEDAYIKLKEWKEEGYKLYIYSSGSVKAQRLFFGHTNFGDLTMLFDGFFDTSVGGKKEKESYFRIAKAVGFDTRECLFLSDTEEELDAANFAGMKTIRVVRDGPVVNSKHRVVKHFLEISKDFLIAR